MAHIRIDYDGLAQQASTISSISESYEALNTRLKALEQKIDSGWEGEASKAYSEMMKKYILQSEKMKGIIDEFKSYGTMVSNDFQEVDKTCATWIRDAF